MPEILASDFSAGFRPSDEIFGGPQNSLLRMQNLKLDKTGALSPIPGVVSITGSNGNAIHTLFKKQDLLFNSQSSGNSYVNGSLIGNGGSNVRAAYGVAYNEVLLCSGAVKKRVPINDPNNPTLIAPKTPLAMFAPSVNSQYSSDFTGTLASYAVEGDGSVAVSTSYVKSTTSGASKSAAVCAALIYGVPQGMNACGILDGTPNDLFHITFKCSHPALLSDITIQLSTDGTNFFRATFVSEKSVTTSSDSENWSTGLGNGFTTPQLIDSLLECKRSDFTPFGQPSWGNIIKVEVLVNYGAAPIDAYDFFFKDIKWVSGGPLSGNIKYMQVNTRSTGGYLAKSIAGPSVSLDCNQSTVHLTPAASAGIGYEGGDGYQMYRTGGTLQRWYLVKTGTGVAAFDDNVTDDAALEIDITYDLNYSTINAISESIFSIVGPYFNRWLYFSDRAIYISEDGNPSGYLKGTGVLTPYHTLGEVFLWAIKYGNSSIFVGTSQDVYEISGTLTPAPDGTIDVMIRSLGVKQPPVSQAVTSDSNSVFYIAADGIRYISPNGAGLISEQLDLLFKGQTRYSLNPIDVKPLNQNKCSLAIWHNELFASLRDVSGAQVCYVFDLMRKYWYEYQPFANGAPTELFTDETGNLYGAVPANPGSSIYQLNIGTVISNSTPLYALSKAFDGGMPRQRKDSYTLKLRGKFTSLQAILQTDLGSINLGTFTNASLTETAIDIFGRTTLNKWYQLSLNWYYDSTSELTDFSIDFEPRPVPLTSYRISYTNLGSTARKRFIAFAFIIDTCGNDVTFTPYIDNIAYDSRVINTRGKFTYIYYFASEAAGTDIGGVLTGGIFEFYQISFDECVSEKMPAPATLLIIPNNNFGVAAKKRIRVIPFVINTRGADVTYTPTIDNVNYPPVRFNTNKKQTCFYYFISDAFGVDLGGVLSGSFPFEFYGILTPDVVETLPVGKLFDQLGPIEFLKLGSLKGLRLRLVPEGYSVSYSIYLDDAIKVSGAVLAVVPNADKVYDIPWLNKNLNGTTCRIELMSNLPFHRLSSQIKVNITGGQTQGKWMKL